VIKGLALFEELGVTKAHGCWGRVWRFRRGRRFRRLEYHRFSG